jgi:hypothetical protein
MHREGIKRFALLSVVVTALVAGVGMQPSSAKSSHSNDTYSEQDCQTIQNIEVKDPSSGYWGATARNAAKAFHGAAADIENATLKSSMNTLASVWGAAGRAHNVIAASRITAKKAKPYGKALAVYVKAATTCATTSFDEETTTTTTSDTSSDSSSSDSSDTSDTSSDSSQ